MEAAVLGILSLIIWALILVVTVKYIFLILRADNQGEGGPLSLMVLARRASRGHLSALVFGLGIIGTALLFGDAIITPAISVLSAMEGIEHYNPDLAALTLPASFVIISALFFFQRYGTKRVSAFFGPIMLAWFLLLAFGGITHVIAHPAVFMAIDPRHGVEFLTHNGVIGLISIGAVFLAVTGAEALYADLGHFGRRPIQRAWIVLILPALTLNYLGQGALVLTDHKSISNPFFGLYSDFLLLPCLILATLATIIASQAVITGAYSLSRQAVQLGLLPRLEVRHTSEDHMGQIYVPRINRLLFFGVIIMLVTFQSSQALASAYGVAVTGTMVVTTLMAVIVARLMWRWSYWLMAITLFPLFLIDLSFFAANLTKLFSGGLMPILLASFIAIGMHAWKTGISRMRSFKEWTGEPLDPFISQIRDSGQLRVDGSAVFLTSQANMAPPALLQNLRHNKVLQNRIILLTINYSDSPKIPPPERVAHEVLSEGFEQIILTFGYMDEPNIPKSLIAARGNGVDIDISNTSFFMSNRQLVFSPRSSPTPYVGPKWSRRWKTKLFIWLSKNASDAPNTYRIPPTLVVELGIQIKI